MVEEEAEKEIAALSKHREDVKKREQELLELEKQREVMEKEREEMGVMWGMGMYYVMTYIRMYVCTVETGC